MKFTDMTERAHWGYGRIIATILTSIMDKDTSSQRISGQCEWSACTPKGYLYRPRMGKLRAAQNRRTLLRESLWSRQEEFAVRPCKGKPPTYKVGGFESVGARGFEPPTSCTPFNGKRVHRVI